MKRLAFILGALLALAPVLAAAGSRKEFELTLSAEERESADHQRLDA
jgi:hypothetical protein